LEVHRQVPKRGKYHKRKQSHHGKITLGIIGSLFSIGRKGGGCDEISLVRGLKFLGDTWAILGGSGKDEW